MSDELIEAHRDNEKLMPYLHLPVQSGSDAILKSMNRRHTRADYFRIIERIKAARPDMALSGDFIVGFPGETDVDFEQTLSIVREVGYVELTPQIYELAKKHFVERKVGTAFGEGGSQVGMTLEKLLSREQ